jgi:hypothetical protein
MKFLKGMLKMVKRDLVAGEFVVVKISGKVTMAQVINGGNKDISVMNLKTNRVCNLKSLRAVRSVTSLLTCVKNLIVWD